MLYSLAPLMRPQAFFMLRGGDNNMHNYQRPHSPFEDSAAQRLRRMGLTTEDGSPERDAMAVFGTIFAGQFFDDLCDTYESLEAISKITAAFCVLEERNDPQRIFLLLSLQYDALRKPLPDPVWWISGSPDFAELFAEDFLAHLKRLAENT